MDDSFIRYECADDDKPCPDPDRFPADCQLQKVPMVTELFIAERIATIILVPEPTVGDYKTWLLVTLRAAGVEVEEK